MYVLAQVSHVTDYITENCEGLSQVVSPSETLDSLAGLRPPFSALLSDVVATKQAGKRQNMMLICIHKTRAPLHVVCEVLMCTVD